MIFNKHFCFKTILSKLLNGLHLKKKLMSIKIFGFKNLYRFTFLFPRLQF